MGSRLILPPVTYLGKDALLNAMHDICALGERALIVTGKSMAHQGYLDELIRLLHKGGVESETYMGISGEPTDDMIEQGVSVYAKQRCDFIIGFGGGSSLDAAKAIGGMVTNPGRITDYNGTELTIPIPPLVAVPSTAGTGSEATQFTIVTDTKKNIKMLLKGTVLMPRIAVVDAKFTMKAPQKITAASGLDALTHAIEAYTSRKACDMSDWYAVSAIRRIFKNLPAVYQNGEDKAARMEMSLAAYEAGISFNNSSVTLVHGMSRPIGALFHVPHGMSNAILLYECLKFAVEGAVERFGQLGREIGAADEADDDQCAAFKFLEAVKRICEVCNVPTLAELGIDRTKFHSAVEKMAQDAWDSGSPSNTRKNVTREDMRKIYCRLWA